MFLGSFIWNFERLGGITLINKKQEFSIRKNGVNSVVGVESLIAILTRLWQFQDRRFQILGP